MHGILSVKIMYKKQTFFKKTTSAKNAKKKAKNAKQF
jgi:hypothetical protein